MSLLRYPHYKPCEDAFLREYPSHWAFVRADSVLETSRRIVQPTEMADRRVYHYSIPVLQETGAGQLEDGATIDSAKTLIDKRCVLVSKLNPRKGTVCIAEPHGDHVTVSSGELIPLIPRHGAEEYVHYAVQSATYRDRLSSLVESATRSHQRASVDDVVKFRWAFPPTAEQRTIVDFLDRETAKIDALIAQQERLTPLLQEKRQAIISHAVTKGLDANVPMKDSGVSWIGSMPAHWTAAPLRYQSRVLRGASPRPIDDPKYFSDDGEYGWVRISDVTSSGMRLVATEQRLSDLGSSLSAKLEPGALFVSIAGSVGKASIAAARVCVHDGFVYFPDLSSPMTEYLYFIFESGVCFQGLGNVGTQLNLNTGLVGGISVPQMPRDEMMAVTSFVQQRVAALESSIADAIHLVKILRERRTALITAAVTGQINVRGLVETAA